MELPVVNHKDYFAKIGEDHKFPINKFGDLANYLIKEKIVKNGNFLKLSIITFIISPFPAPNSTRLNFFGDPKLSQKLIVHIATISEKSLEMFGPVVKSPVVPNGLLFI